MQGHWTKEPPKEDGFYFAIHDCFDERDDPIEIFELKIMPLSKYRPVEIYGHNYGGLIDKEYVLYWWSHSIELPEVPNEVST